MSTAALPHPRAAASAGRRAVAALVAVLTLCVGAVVGVQRAEPAAAATFDPGMIISDAAFYAGTSMSAPEIQAFLDAKNPSCRPGADGTLCLKAFRADTFTRPADSRCTGTYVGTGNESAAQIIAKVGAACGISPKVILVMLQKEQSLVTASGSGLYATRYRSAMGFGCPDTAPCDATYYGFFNQVYQAAWQLRNYALSPTKYAHRAGMVNNVRYHPNVACGSSAVLIQNQATASLYNYTPYQPNNAALAAGYGTGDACSAYGNRNFWLYYNAWFGATNAAPIGVIDSVVATNTTLTLSGWSLDPDSSLSNDVHLYVDGVGVAIKADQPRPDVGAVFGLGDAHGWSWSFPVRPGARSYCVYGISVGYGDNTVLGCGTVVVPDQVPIGGVTSVTTSLGSVTITGWSIDPDTTEPNDVHLYIDGVGVSLRADLSRPDIAAAYGKGDRHGFSYTTTLGAGTHSMCVYGINTAPADNTVLDCRSFVVRTTNTPPTGVIDRVATTAGDVTVSGWAFDPDTTQPNEVHVYIDGVGVSLLADQPRPDVGAVYGRGPAAGWSHTRPLAPGNHSMCAYSINTTPGDNTLLGCRSFTLADAAPLGVIDTVATTPATGGAPGSVTIAGWTFDPDTAASTQAHVYVDGVGVAIDANLSRPDVGAVYRRGDKHGYVWTAPMAAGVHAMCVYGISGNAGANTLLGCRSFTVPTA
ncbi:hypothetical protein [Actinotalea solisilvae]|uniref:hypothetical protein n=1 Tax=Actinotalea solisilvae TaxID=2072922 RepID=UPI0018F157CB|nr:hypothetical protein [Actinotalea solisilvae]